MNSTLRLAVVLVVFSFRAPAVAAPSQPPNFVVILTDDQSWIGTSTRIDPDRLDSRSDFFRTPHIDRLAAAGMRFTQGYAPAPFCCPTRRSLVVGQCPARHIYHKDQQSWTDKYRAQLSIPRMLKRADPRYRTAHFGKWDLRFDGVTPAEMGYDVSDGPTRNVDGQENAQKPASKFVATASNDPKQMFAVTERACRFLENRADDNAPFYLQVSHYAVHLNVYYRQETLDRLTARPLGTRHRSREFAAMTEDMDDAIGQLINRIEQLKLRDNTYIIFLSDNGGKSDSAHFSYTNLPLRDGKGSMYEGGLRVPFFVAGPGIETNATCRVPVTGLDILPTLAELARYPDSLPSNIDGGSLVPLWESPGTATVARPRPFLVFYQAGQRKLKAALRLGDMKLVRTALGSELFDLSQDFEESHDLSAELPEQTGQLSSQLDRYLQEVGAQ